jgi:DinB family protein
MSSTDDDPLMAALVEQLRAMRAAERDLFGGLAPDVRDRPMRPNDWSPKDHQAHLTAWKGIQAERIRANTRGEDPPFIGRETDEINAELQAARADASWDAIVAEADAVTDALEAEIRAAGSAALVASGGLIGGIFGNGSSHAMTHFGWLADAGIGIDEARVAAFVDAQERLLTIEGVPDSDRGIGLYNLACAHALAGRIDRARGLLPTAFRLRPDLADYAKEDPDLVELRDELSALAAAG